MFFFHCSLDTSTRPWERYTNCHLSQKCLKENEDAKQAYTALIRVTPKMPKTSDINTFLKSVIRIAKDEFNLPYSKEEVCVCVCVCLIIQIALYSIVVL